MKTIYLVRHGQTFFNLHHKVQGRVDSPLTDLGIRQAKKLREYFNEKNIKFDKAYCSTQERASDTLEIITNFEMEYERLKDLREKSYGMYEGQDQYTLPWHYGQEREGIASMEPDHEAVARIDRAMTKILRENPHARNILVVGHGDVLARYVRQHDKRNIFNSFGNGEVAVLEENDGHVSFIESYWPARGLE